ncbi:MAG: ketoacyl-ACP synthase III [Cylindrospermopsis raciborskii]|jgi:3-oxoacyl-[acyl-carrier-protein] synthase-3|uniref:ketoacyl-ACP synthase III n=1 Tax=Cylindrospermopsis raciborskii TaxID=77022 RepID=UPI003D0E1BDD
MVNSVFKQVKISGIVSVTPENYKTIDEEIDMYGGNQKQIDRIKKTIGINKRHVVSGNTTSADLCLYAAEQLLINMSRSKHEIDALVVVTQTPDHFQPCNAAVVHGRLGLKKSCAALDVNLGCSGYIYGLWLSHMMVTSGNCKVVLLLAGDTISRCVNPRDRSTAPLFGDAGSATLVESEALDTETKTYFGLHTDGSGCGLIQVPAGAFRHPTSSETLKQIQDQDGNWHSQNDLHMNGGEVFNFSVSVEPASINQILDYSNTDIDEIDYFVFHQANKYIISNIARRLHLPMAKVPCSIVEKYGNLSSASIPSAINDELSQEISKSRLKLVLSGFGVGLSWASCLIELDSIYCPPVLLFKEHIDCG